MKMEQTNTQAPDVKYSLKMPITFEGQEITEVMVCRLKGRDVIAAEREMRARGVKDPGEMERTLYLVARSIGKPMEVVEEMDAIDIAELNAKAQAFFG